ncbi:MULTISPECIES: PHB depolymerase family esterase [unclassified Halomonas]|uniref:PHB depolymerase family esterase n=1 Tax=unclassified Halomonas TaxID=2609666 RepID=UPI0009907375|nr:MULTISPECIES: PHB depolymerase family esterase [unclassified Halomonas]AQU84297.1 poly(3-hydroxybutyrate) depolymerase [Halomonas sp. 'Soap Lake \
MCSAPFVRSSAGVLAMLVTSVAYAEKPASLPQLSATSDQASVVGVSSGGYMAAQLAVAWPERFSGVGILAAGPWGCAQGALSLALNQCMTTRRGLPSLDDLDARRERYASQGQVGSQEALSLLRAFVWHGAEDGVVVPELGSLLAEQWQTWLGSPDQLRAVSSDATGHGWPVRLPREAAIDPQSLGGCRQGGGSHVLACNEDVASEMLGWLYPERQLAASEGELVAFDQSEFAVKGLANTGYVFIPEVCEAGGCPVTVALHGCQMSADAIGDTFIRHSGLNRWAEEYGQVVLYPQAKSSMANPQGCWDWWGFAESTWQLSPLHDTREGTQVRALMAMLDRLQSALVQQEALEQEENGLNALTTEP